MTAEVGRTARWRRWAHLPAVLALLFATTVVAATASAPGPAPAPLGVQAVNAPGQHPAGQRPDVRVDARGMPGTIAPDLGAPGWLPARAGAGIATWWHRRQDVDGHRAQARRETYQGRGPPGARAAHAPS